MADIKIKIRTNAPAVITNSKALRRWFDSRQPFRRLTDYPGAGNTALNIRDEPIPFALADAFMRFMGTDLDVLTIGDAFPIKEPQNTALGEDY